MDGFTLIDGIVAAVILVSAILAYSRGLVRESMAILGWIAAAVVGFLFAPAAAPLMSELPVVGDILGDSCQLGMIAGFAVVMALALVVVSLFTPLMSSMIQRSALSGVDQALGFLFGIARGVLLVMVIFILFTRFGPADPIPMVDNSRTAAVLGQSQEAIDNKLPDDAPGWLEERYNQLVSSCPAGEA